MDLFTLYINYFYSFFKIGLFGFGGGYAMLSLVQHEVVENHKWLTTSDFTDIVAISQTTPGPIAFNTATYVGYATTTQLGYSTGEGVIGSLICTVAVSLPSFILMLLVCRFFLLFRNNFYVDAILRGLKPAIIGLIAAAALLLINSHNFIDYKSWLLFAGVFVASLKKIDPILLIVLSGICGYIMY